MNSAQPAKRARLLKLELGGSEAELGKIIDHVLICHNYDQS